MTQTKQQKVQKAVAAKREGRQELLRDIFRETRQIEIDWGHVNDDLRRLSLAKTALASLLRKVEMLERSKDQKSLQKLIARFQSSSIQKTIDAASVDDDTFHEMLQDILGEEEASVSQGLKGEDAGFAEFDRAVGMMAQAEEADSGEGVSARPARQAGPDPLNSGKVMSDESEEEKRQREEIERQIREMEQEIEQWNREIDEMKRQVAALRAEAARLHSQAAGVQADVEAKQAELERLIAEGEATLDLQTALKEVMTNLLYILKDLQNQEAEHTSKADRLESQIAGKEREVIAKEQQIASLLSEMA